MLKMVDGTGIIGVDMVCPLGGTVSPPQPPNYDRVELEGTGMLVLPNSLDAPLERLELGGKTEQAQTTGAQLFDKNSVVNGVIIADGSVTDNAPLYATSDYIPVKPSVMYACTETGSKRLKFFDIDKQPVQKINYEDANVERGGTFTTGETTRFIRLSLLREKLDSIMLNEGSKSISYEPYTGGKPSPSPEYPQEIKNSGKWNEEKQKYEVNVKVTGKNRFDREKAKDVSNWISIEGDGYLKFPIRAKKGSMITFSYTEKLTEGKKFYLGIAKKETGSVIAWLYHDTNLSVSNSKYTIVSEEGYVYLMCNKSAIQNFLDAIQTLQVEISQTQTEYEPYKEQTLTLTSDRPITKWDRLVEQGGEIGWLYGGKIIDSYNSEQIDAEYMSSTGSLTVGATVLYKLKTTEFVPIPQSEQNAIRALKTYYPTTVITADGGELDPDIKATYRKEI